MLSSKLFRALPLVLLGASVAFCGGSEAAKSDLYVDSGPDSDGAIGSDGATSACHSIGTACVGGGECCVNVCTSGACGGVSGDSSTTKACNLQGSACAKGFDCCSGTCNGGSCVGNTIGGSADGGAPGGSGPLSCSAPTSSCTLSAECCSGRCEPVVGQAGVIKCRDACRADGLACADAQDCCGLGCFDGVCTSKKLCLVVGDSCTVNSECCSSVCDQSKKECAVDLANSTCRPTGEDCSSGPQSGCCGATKANDLCVDGRCALPPTACHGNTATCASDSECCSGHCDAASKTCAVVKACTPSLGACVTGADCCAASCTNGSCDAPVAPPPVVGSDAAPPALCISTGASCTDSASCCSSLCLGTFCAVRPN